MVFHEDCVGLKVDCVSVSGVSVSGDIFYVKLCMPSER